MRKLRTANALLGAMMIGLTVAAVACGSSSDDAPTTVPSPPGDLYQPPDPLELAPPGTLIWAEKVEGLELEPPATIWAILYHSRSRDDRDIAVSGFAIVPTADAPEGGRPVYAWAHGTAGVGDQCAPSHDVRESLPPYGGIQIERGAILVATDYEGLGTPGVATQAVGLAEGQAVLDSIRAAASLPDVGTLSDVIVAGHSQGGRAALFASEIAPSYAPELQLVGAVAYAPGAELPELVDYLAASPSKGVVLIGAIGLSAAYPDLDLMTILTASAIADLPRIETECVDTTVERYEELDPNEVFASVPSSAPELMALFEENSPGAAAPPVPVLLVHGEDDEQVPVVVSEQLLAKYCELGVAVTRHVYGGVDHDGVIDAAMDDVLAFVADRYDHVSPATSCE